MSLLRQETRLFAALWLGTMNDMVPEAGDAREVSKRLFEAGDASVSQGYEHPIRCQKISSTCEEETPFEQRSSWVH